MCKSRENSIMSPCIPIEIATSKTLIILIVGEDLKELELSNFAS